jgi:hypothetical protein
LSTFTIVLIISAVGNLAFLLVLIVLCHVFILRRTHNQGQAETQAEGRTEQSSPTETTNRYADLNVVLNEPPTPEWMRNLAAANYDRVGEREPLLSRRPTASYAATSNPYKNPFEIQRESSSVPTSFFATINPLRLFHRNRNFTVLPPTRHVSMEDIPLESPPPSYASPSAPPCHSMHGSPRFGGLTETKL